MERKGEREREREREREKGQPEKQRSPRKKETRASGRSIDDSFRRPPFLSLSDAHDAFVTTSSHAISELQLIGGR